MTEHAAQDSAGSIDLFWLPLGAGGHSVRWNGRVFEAIAARREHRSPLDIYHSALEVRRDDLRYVIEMAPVWQNTSAPGRGVVREGPVGATWLGHSRLFRYEVRCWLDGAIPDLAMAVDSPRRLSSDRARADGLLALLPCVPGFTWGRDETGCGDMWNSNSLVAWLLARTGHDMAAIRPPAGGVAPGWRSGLALAAGPDVGRVHSRPGMGEPRGARLVRHRRLFLLPGFAVIGQSKIRRMLENPELFCCGRATMDTGSGAAGSPATLSEAPVVTTDCAHQVQFYGSDDALGLTVSSFLAVPLLRGEASLIVASAEHREQFATALAASGLDVPALRLQGRYLELDPADTLALFMTDAGPDEARFRGVVGAAVEQAVDRFGAVTAYGEMVGLLAAQGQLVAALELETLWNRLIRDSRLRLLCGYRTEHVSAGTSYESVCAAHDAISAPRSLSAAIDLPLGAEASTLARRAAVSVCRAWGITDAEWIDDLGLVVAELVGNAVRHSSSRVALSLDAHDDRITVSVTDGSHAMPLPRTGDELAEDGRGFSIIDALSDAWGVERHPSGKRVWAELRPHHAELTRPSDV